jgi:hypothetical protein
MSSCHGSSRDTFRATTSGQSSNSPSRNLTQRKLAVVILVAASNALEDLLPLVPETLKAIESIQSGQVLRVQER